MAGAIAGLGVRVSEANDTRATPPAAEASLRAEAPPALIGIQSTDASPNLLQAQRTHINTQPPSTKQWLWHASSLSLIYLSAWRSEPIKKIPSQKCISV